MARVDKAFAGVMGWEEEACRGASTPAEGADKQHICRMKSQNEYS